MAVTVIVTLSFISHNFVAATAVIVIVIIIVTIIASTIAIVTTAVIIDVGGAVDDVNGAGATLPVLLLLL